MAARVPDGHITAHANISRITTFPLDDKENWLYAPDVVTFAIEQGFYKTDSGKPFSFRDAYHPGINVANKRACAGRVWSIYRRAAPSLELQRRLLPGRPRRRGLPAVHQARREALAPRRDGADARPLRGDPLRHDQGRRRRPVRQPLSLPRPGVEGRRDLLLVGAADLDPAGRLRHGDAEPQVAPRPGGGVYLVHPRRRLHLVLHPALLRDRRTPRALPQGDHNRFSWDSAWWVFNMVSNLTYDRWSRIIPDVQAVQREREDALLKMQPVIEEAAVKLGQSDPALMRTFLTDYSVSTAEGLFRRWKELAESILTRHNDGYVNDRTETPKAVGYSQEWLRKVLSEKPKQFRVDEPTDPKDKGDR